MSFQLYTSAPPGYEDYYQIWLPQSRKITHCLKCQSLLVTEQLPGWFASCLNCKSLYIFSPVSCFQLRGWDIKKCCKQCHLSEKNLNDGTKIFQLTNGTYVDVCCEAAAYLKHTGELDINAVGIGLNCSTFKR